MSQCNQVPTREEEEGGGVGQTINTLVPPPPPLRHPTKRNAHTHARTRRRRHMPRHPGHILHIQTCSQARPSILPPSILPFFTRAIMPSRVVPLPQCTEGSRAAVSRVCSTVLVLEVCVFTRAAGRTDPLLLPPSEVAGGPLPNDVIQRSR